MTEPAIVNIEQAEAWNEGMGRAWAAHADFLDRQIRPIGHAVMELAAIRQGDAILDVGCGCGQTSFEMAGAVGAHGRVHGVDISALLIGIARQRASGAQIANVQFEVADAQAAHFERAGYDLIFSRFGIMFFNDPAAAFSNLRWALKPSGRLAFCCWREPESNPFMILPMQAAAHLLPPGDAPPPGAPGPFAFADPQRVAHILEEAGFHGVSLQKRDIQIDAGDMRTALDLSVGMGPLGGRLREIGADADLRSAVESAVAKALAPFTQADGRVVTRAAVWIARAAY